jgi:hypothetical protein
VETTIAYQGRSEAAALHDISERGCHLITPLRCPIGHKLELPLTRFGVRVEGVVVQQTETGMHLSFSGDGLPTADVDRISLATAAEMMKLARSDHEAFTKRVADAVASGDKLPPESLASPHHCRFGRWYDDVTDRAAMALPSFKAIKAPHKAVHDLGRQALVALNADDRAAAQRLTAEMRSQSERVLACLEDFTREYPTTFTATAIAA